MDCKHVFVGKADGVHCKKCGLHMTPKEYRDYVEGAQEKKEETPAEPAKPKRTRKKKEETDNE